MSIKNKEAKESSGVLWECIACRFNLENQGGPQGGTCLR